MSQYSGFQPLGTERQHEDRHNDQSAPYPEQSSQHTGDGTERKVYKKRQHSFAGMIITRRKKKACYHSGTPVRGERRESPVRYLCLVAALRVAAVDLDGGPMCLIFAAFRVHPNYPLVIAANRDEFYHRSTLAAGWWDDAPDLMAGRDMEAGGTWMGITRQGRFAAVTNYRNPDFPEGEHSRGELTRDFLLGDASPEAHGQSLLNNGATYSGYNLLLADRSGFAYVNNHGAGTRSLPPGLYGLSNGELDAPWPKVRDGKALMAKILQRGNEAPDRQALYELLADNRSAEDNELPETGVGLDLERLLSPRFIKSPGYGTRALSVLTMRADGLVEFDEWSFGPGGTPISDVHHRFDTGLE